MSLCFEFSRCELPACRRQSIPVGANPRVRPLTIGVWIAGGPRGGRSDFGRADRHWQPGSGEVSPPGRAGVMLGDGWSEIKNAVGQFDLLVEEFHVGQSAVR